MRDPSDLQRSYEVLRKAIQTTNCGLIARDSRGRILFANDTALKWLGYERHELVGQPLDMLVPPELREVARGEQTATEQGDLRTRLTVLQRKDSTTFAVAAVPSRVQNAPDGSISTYAILVDLGAIQTAKRSGSLDRGGLRDRLEQIADELHAIGLSSEVGRPDGLSLDHTQLRDLTGREKEVLAHLLAGDRVPIIADQLNLSAHTVRNHLKAIFRKVGVRNQSELIGRVRALGSE